MALVKCPECGQEISDQATSCPNCGCLVKKKGVENETEIINVTEGNISKKQIPKIGIIGGILVIAILVIFGVSKTFKSSDDLGYYNNCQWGITLEDLEVQIELEGGGYIENDDGSIYGNIDNFCGVEGLDGVPLYIMKNNGLSEVQILLTYDEDLYTGDEMLDLMSEKFTKLYGKDKGAIVYIFLSSFE